MATSTIRADGICETRSNAFVIATTGGSGLHALGASGMSGPSSPESPWISGHVLFSRIKGLSAPLWTCTSSLPSRCNTRSALSVVLSTVWLPHTVETPATITAGFALWHARMSANASSCPGSQSTHT